MRLHPKTVWCIGGSLEPTYGTFCDFKKRPMVKGQFGGKRTNQNTVTFSSHVPCRLQPAVLRDYRDADIPNDVNAYTLFFPSEYILSNMDLVTITEPDLGDYEVLHSYTDSGVRLENKALLTKRSVSE